MTPERNLRMCNMEKKEQIYDKLNKKIKICKKTGSTGSLEETSGM